MNRYACATYLGRRRLDSERDRIAIHVNNGRIGSHNLESSECARLIVNLITDKKGENIILMDLREITLIADYFVIASANNERLLNAITDNVRDELKKQTKRPPLRVEGRGDSGWVLMDYGEVVVHLFAPDVRAYYDLEGLWADANVLVKV